MPLHGSAWHQPCLVTALEATLLQGLKAAAPAHQAFFSAQMHCIRVTWSFAGELHVAESHAGIWQCLLQEEAQRVAGGGRKLTLPTAGWQSSIAEMYRCNCYVVPEQHG